MELRRSKRLAHVVPELASHSLAQLVKQETNNDRPSKKPRTLAPHITVKLEEVEPTVNIKHESQDDPTPLQPMAIKAEHEPIKNEPVHDPMLEFRTTFDDAEFLKQYPEDGPGTPANWREIYRRVKIMRTQQLAPVDTMGCERLPVHVKISPALHRFQLLISLMLSAQTKDEVTAKAVANLRAELPGQELTVSSIIATSETEIDRLICKVGFHTRKASYIKRACEILRQEYNDDVPGTVEAMMELPGVGPKMAYLLAQRAWGIMDGIGVDVHVHRLANLWKWTKKPTNTPEKTRLELQEWLPKSLWYDINPALVGFGQTICLPRGSKCGQCLVGDLCPSYRKEGSGGNIPLVSKRKR